MMRAMFLALSAVGFLLPAAPVFGQSAPTQATADQGEDKMICRKFLETGSLVKKRKVCMTQSEWKRVQISQREGSEKMVQELSGGFREQCGINC